MRGQQAEVTSRDRRDGPVLGQRFVDNGDRDAQLRLNTAEDGRVGLVGEKGIDLVPQREGDVKQGAGRHCGGTLNIRSRS